MHCKKISIQLLGLVASLLLTGCFGGDEEETRETTEEVVVPPAIQLQLDNAIRQPARPSALTGIMGAWFISTANFAGAQSASSGLEMQLSILEGQQRPDSSETFIVLQEMGNLLSTDIHDVLNRSPNRATALNTYLETVESITLIGGRKRQELEERIDTIEDERKQQKRVVRDLDKEIKRAKRDDNFSLATSKQELLQKAERDFEELDSNLKQTEDMLKNYEQLIEKLNERRKLLDANREVLIAGLKVEKQPGIEDLGIYEDR